MHNERCRDCKAAIAGLLAAHFGVVKANYDIGRSARLEDYAGTEGYDYLARIHSSLQAYRGFDNFVLKPKLAPVDFYIPERNLIVEIDESQHFTAPRKIALSGYPKTHQFGFNTERWIRLCSELNKKDNSPPFRDEQRAWYDTLRDFAPIGWKSGAIIRIYIKDFAWCELNPQDDRDVQKFLGLTNLDSIAETP